MSAPHEPADAALERYLAGESSPAERVAIDAWLASSPARASAVARLCDAVTAESTRAGWRTERALARLRSRIAERESSPRLRTASRGRPLAAPVAPSWRRVAAVLVATAALAAGGLAYSRRDGMTTVATRRGERVVVRLADGSVVHLGPATTLRYHLGDRRRALELDGLADFQVNHDASRPFVVHSRNVSTTDVGTEFTVRAYPGADVDVAVTGGRVSLSPVGSNHGAAPTVLGAGEEALVTSAGSVTVRSDLDARSALAWRDGELTFREATLTQVADELSRWFDVDIRIADPALARRRVTATYTHPTLNGVLDAVTLSLGARVERRGTTVILERR